MNFNACPDYASIVTDYMNQAYYIRMYWNAQHVQEALDLVQLNCRDSMMKKCLNTGVTDHSISTFDDWKQELYVRILDNIEHYLPVQIDVIVENKLIPVKKASDHGLLDRHTACEILDLSDTLNHTIGTPDCPYADIDEFTADIEKISPLPIKVCLASPYGFFSSSVTDVQRSETCFTNGMNPNDYKRVQDVRNGNHIPKRKETLDALNRAVNIRKTSFEQTTRPIYKDNDNAAPLESRMTSIFTGASATTCSAEEKYEEEQSDELTELLIRCKRMMKDAGIERHLASRMFLKKQVEHVIQGDLDLSIQDLTDYIDKLSEHFKKAE